VNLPEIIAAKGIVFEENTKWRKKKIIPGNLTENSCEEARKIDMYFKASYGIFIT